MSNGTLLLKVKCIDPDDDYKDVHPELMLDDFLKCPKAQCWNVDIINPTRAFDDDTLHAIWAALCSMVQDIHAPQDNLNAVQWIAAETAFELFDKEVNLRAKHEK